MSQNISLQKYLIQMPQTTTERPLLEIMESIESFKKILSNKNTQASQIFSDPKYKNVDFSKVHIIIGSTGQGKSSLLNYIIDNPMIGSKPKNSPFLVSTDNQNGKIKTGLNGIIEIGHTPQSTTTIPNFYFDEQRGTCFWDCCGFNDNKGQGQDITNGYYIREIFQSCKEFKLILVVSEKSILAKATDFLTVLDQLQKALPLLEKSKEAITLVVTKTKDIQDAQGVKQKISEILEDLQNSLNHTQKKFLSHLASQKGNVALFPAPTQKDEKINKDAAELIRNSIKICKFAPSFKIKIPVTLKSTNYLKGLAKELNSQIQKIFSSNNKLLHEKIQQNHLGLCLSYKAFKTEVSKVIKNLDPMFQSKNQNQFIINWTKIAQLYKINWEKEKLQKLIQFIQWIRSVDQKVQFAVLQWDKKFQVRNLLLRLQNQPQNNFIEKDSTLKINSHLLNSMQILEFVEAQGLKKIKDIVIQCYHTLFIDKDFDFPGISLCVFSQNWKIIENRRINLKGSDADPYCEAAKSNSGHNQQGRGLNGQDGLPGRPGKIGGSFFGKKTSFKGIFGPGKLTIDVRGGNGGDGQVGGEGGEGIQGKDSIEKEPVQKRSQKCLVSRIPYNWADKNAVEQLNQAWKKFGTFNSQMLETYRSVGQQGRQGGNGGKGGAGGLPGDSGIVQIKGFEAQIISGKGEKGQTGSPGLCGLGGANGKKYEGEYINETMFTAFRDVGKTVDVQSSIITPIVASQIIEQTAIAMAARQAANLAAKKAAELASQQFAVNAAKMAAIQAAKIAAQQAAKQAAVQMAKLTAQQAAAQLAKQSAKQALLEATKAAAQQAVIEGLQLAVEQTAIQCATLSGQKTAIKATKSVAIQAANKGIQQASKKAVVQTAKIATQQVAQKTAQQAAIQVVAQQYAFSGLLGGFATFGMSLVIQTVASIVSAYASSGWKKQPSYQQNGRGQSGTIPDSVNQKNRQKSHQELFRFSDNQLQQWQSEFVEVKSKD